MTATALKAADVTLDAFVTNRTQNCGRGKRCTDVKSRIFSAETKRTPPPAMGNRCVCTTVYSKAQEGVHSKSQRKKILSGMS